MEGAVLKLYNLSGKQVFSRVIPLNGKIHLPEMKNGLYILEITQGDQSVLVRKVMKG